jgi:hypothetical protein
MFPHEENNHSFKWTQEEEEEAYKEFLESMKTFPESQITQEKFFSEEKLERIHERIFGQTKPKRFPRAKKFWVIVAAAAAILGTMTTAAAFQNRFRRFFLHESSIATDVEVLPPDDGENSETISYYWDAAYVPEGYVLGYESISDLMTVLIYDSEEGSYIEISTLSLSTIPSIDTENTQRQEIEINNYSGYLYTTKDDSKTWIIILYEDCFVTIGGKVPQTEILKIAESLYKENFNIKQEESQ